MTQKQINELKSAYIANAEDLKAARCAYEDGEVECAPNESFEQGYNNALEFVFRTLGIKFEYTA